MSNPKTNKLASPWPSPDALRAYPALVLYGSTEAMAGEPPQLLLARNLLSTAGCEALPLVPFPPSGTTSGRLPIRRLGNQSPRDLRAVLVPWVLS
jgi:hypothetical protein